MKEEDKYGWNPVKTGENRTSGSSEARTVITGDTTGWDKPTEYDFKAPERERYKYNPDEGILSVFRPKEPEWDANREDRLNRLARVNAFGDFVKHLGSFSGGGYAPTEKRGENKGVLRAFAELDKMRDVYESRKDKYNDQLFGWQAQDYMDQRNRADREYDRKYADEKDKANRDWQTAEASRAKRENAYWEGNTIRRGTQSGKSEQFKNLDLLMAEMAAKRKAGSGKNDDFNAYIKGVGDLTVSKSAQIQIGTRIKDAMLKAGRINEKDAAGLMAALAGAGSRNAFQSLLGYMRYPDVWDACKQFLGHGMDLTSKEDGGTPTDNNDSGNGGNTSGSASGGNPGWPSALPPLPNK